MKLVRLNHTTQTLICRTCGKTVRGGDEIKHTEETEHDIFDLKQVSIPANR